MRKQVDILIKKSTLQFEEGTSVNIDTINDEYRRMSNAMGVIHYAIRHAHCQMRLHQTTFERRLFANSAEDRKHTYGLRAYGSYRSNSGPIAAICDDYYAACLHQSLVLQSDILARCYCLLAKKLNAELALDTGKGIDDEAINCESIKQASCIQRYFSTKIDFGAVDILVGSQCYELPPVSSEYSVSLVTSEGHVVRHENIMVDNVTSSANTTTVYNKDSGGKNMTFAIDPTNMFEIRSQLLAAQDDDSVISIVAVHKQNSSGKKVGVILSVEEG